MPDPDPDRVPHLSQVADPSWSLARCLELMLEKHCRHLPLLDVAATATGSTKGRADALLSMRDVRRFLLTLTLALTLILTLTLTLTLTLS